jgi:ribonuclease HI
MYFDDSKMMAGLGAGVVLTLRTGDNIRYVLQIMYTDSNNAAEYEALLHGLRMAVSMGVQRLEVRGDSNLAISQVNGEFDAKDPKMTAYRNAVLKISARFEGLEFHHVSRDNNQDADILARMGAKRDRVPENTFLERLFKPSVVWQDDGKDTVGSEELIPPIIESDKGIIGGSELEETSSAHEVMAVIAPWTEPFLAYLLCQKLPNDRTKARRIIRRSKTYKVHEGELYKKSTTGVLQRCISEEEGRQLLT